MTLPAENATTYPWPPQAYKPLWHQYDMHRSKAKFRWMCSGIGGGKTAWAVIEDFSKCLEYPGVPGAIIVPDFRTWRNVVRPEIEKRWPPGTWRETRPNELVEVDTGAAKKTPMHIYSVSNAQHVNKMLGDNFGWFHLEEPGRMMHGQQAWLNAVGRLRVSGGPLKGWIAGSPFGFGWLTDAWGIESALSPIAYTHGLVTKVSIDKEIGEKTDFFVRGAQTWMNTSLPKNYYASLLSIYGGDKRFVAQELHGGILSQADLILYNYSKPLHVIPRSVALKLLARCDRRHGGVDWGDRVAAMTYGGTIGGPDEGTTVIVDEVYGSEMPGECLGWHAYRKNKEFGNFMWYPDPAEPGEIRKWNRGFMWDGQYIDHVEGTARPSEIKGRKWNEWKPGIDLLQVMLAYIPRIPHPAYEPLRNDYGGARIYISDSCVNLLEEIKNYRWAPQVAGNRKKAEDAIGPHHAIDTLRYQLMGELIQAHPAVHGMLIPGV